MTELFSLIRFSLTILFVVTSVGGDYPQKVMYYMLKKKCITLLNYLISYTTNYVIFALLCNISRDALSPNCQLTIKYNNLLRPTSAQILILIRSTNSSSLLCSLRPQS